MTELQQRIAEDIQEAGLGLKHLADLIGKDVREQRVGSTSDYAFRLRHVKEAIDRSLSAIRVEDGGKP
jgi:hypothetical protein